VYIIQLSEDIPKQYIQNKGKILNNFFYIKFKFDFNLEEWNRKIFKEMKLKSNQNNKYNGQIEI